MLLRSWSWSRAPALFKVVLLLAISVETGLIHNVQGKNYTVGADYVNVVGNASWTNTINGLSQPAALEAAYQKWADSVNFTVGDTINFDYERGQHTVYLVDTKSAYTSCALTAGSGQTLPYGTPTTYTIKDTDVVLYFTCTVSGHCRAGQKVKIVPFGVTVSPTPAPLPPNNVPDSAHASSPSMGTIAMLLLVLLSIFQAQSYGSKSPVTL